MSSCRCSLVCAALAAAALLVAWSLPSQADDVEPLADPIAVRRVLIPSERVSAELERVRQGVLQQLSRKEFDERMKQAGAARAAAKNPPRLVEARYRATLVDDALLGTGQWRIAHAAAGAGILPLPSFNLALQKARLHKTEPWFKLTEQTLHALRSEAVPDAVLAKLNGLEHRGFAAEQDYLEALRGVLAGDEFERHKAKLINHARVDATDTILGDLDGKALGLLIEQPGEYAAYLDWTLRSNPSPGALRFDVRVPACALASLDLNLPADRMISPRDNLLLSGPHAAESAERRLWHIDFAGQSQVDLEIRHVARPGEAPPLVLATLATRLELEPDIARADFDFELEIPHEAVRDFVFECDPALRPYEVVVRNRGLESWETRSPAGPNQPALVAVKLREPFRDGLLPLEIQLRCLAPLATDTVWHSPGVRLQGALPQGESLLVRLHPLVRLENWQSGSFVLSPLSEAEAFPAPRGKTTEGWQVLTLTGTDLKTNRQARPSALVKTQPKEFRTRMLSWWQIGAHASTLTVQVLYEVSQGQLFRLPLTLPPGWEVERVELTPNDLLRNWAVVQENERPTLAVDLQRPLGSASAPRAASAPARLSVWLRTPQRGVVPAAGVDLPFPDLMPVGAYLREGTLGISVDPLFQVKVTASLPPSTAEEKGPWDVKGPDHVFSYRGLPVIGSVHVQPRRTLVQARWTSEVLLAAEGAALTTHLLLEPKIGNPDQVDLQVTAATAGSWTWKTERGPNHVRSFQRLRAVEAAAQLSFLGVRNPLEAAVRIVQPLPQREWWRLTLARPLREPLLLRATCAFEGNETPAGTGVDLLWNVPVPLVLAADPMEGEVVLHMKGVEALSFTSRGPLEMPASSMQSRTSVWRTFRYGPAVVDLLVQGKRSLPGALGGSVSDPVVDRALLAVTVEPEGRLLHHFRFQASHWKQKTLPLRLPAGSHCLEVKVDGRWLGRLDSAVGDNGLVDIAVPFPAGKLSHQYEIIYELHVDRWKTWTVLSAPSPELPVQAVSFRRVWRLPPGMSPLLREQYDKLRGSSSLAGMLWAEPPPRLSGSGIELQSPRTLVHATLSGLNAGDWEVQQRLDLQDAVAAFRNQGRDSKSWTLGEALEYMVFEFLKGKEMLVVDVHALRSRALTPASPLPRTPPKTRRSDLHPPWEDLDLVILPCRSAPLLTTRSQRDSWLSAERIEAVSQALEEGVSEAVQSGHDRTGRLQSLAAWLAATNPSDNNDETFEPGPHDAGLNWTEWQSHAGVDDQRLAIVRQDAIPILGMVLTMGLAWSAWKIRRWRRTLRLTLLVLWLALGGLALLWLPESLRGLAWVPTLCAVTLALFGYLRSVSILSRRKAVPLTASLAAVALTGLPFLSGQAPAPFTVYYLPGAEDAPSKQVVLAPPELLKQLDELAGSGVAGLRQAVLLGAQYEGHVTAAGAEFRAEFRVHAFAEKSTLTLPLAGVQLMPDVLIDGAKAHPQTLEAPREGYTLETKGRGTHMVSLRFSVAIPASGEERGVRFTVPELLQSRLLLDVPAGARFLSSLTGRGRQSITPEIAAGAPADKPLRLDTDLGRVAQVHVRWLQEARASPSANVQVREAYLWRLHPTASSLLAVLQYTVKQGASTTLTLDLPEQLEVRNAEANRLPGSAVDEPAPRLKDWHVTGRGNQRRVHFEFQRPLSGGVQVVAEFIPRQPFGVTAILPLPAPQHARTTEGLLAFQVEGVRAQVAEHLRVNGTDPRTFARTWRTAGMNDPGASAHAYTFQRGLGGAPYLRLNLSMPPSELTCTQKVSWTIGPRQADLAVSARLGAPGRDLVLVEWELPAALQGLEISGADVRSWSRLGGRAQVWMQRPLGTTDIRITGWQPLEEVPSKKTKAREALTLRLAPLGVLATRMQTSFVNIRTNGDFVVTAETLKNLVPTPDIKPSDRELNFLSEQLDVGGLIHMRPLLMRADAQALTLVEIHDHHLTFNSVIDWRVRQGELRTLRVKLQNWPGEEVTIDAPGVLQQREQPRDAMGRSWTLVLPDGITGNYRLKLGGRIPLENSKALPLPDVAVEGASVQERFVAVAGSELRAEDPRGLAPVSDAAQVLRAWPAEAERIRRAGSAWKIQTADWHLRARAQADGIEAAPFRLLLADHEAAIVDGQRWLHQSTFWLYQETGADLVINLPADARLKGLFVDGAAIAQLQPTSQKLWLPLAGMGGAHTIRVRWYADSAVERVDRPLLEAPLLEGVPLGPAQWTVHVPSGYRALAREARADGASDQDLRRIDALLQLSTLLAERLRGRVEGPLATQLTEAQESFYRSCRQAELRLAGPESPLQGYKDRNRLLAKSHSFEDIRARAERQARTFVPPRQTADDKSAERVDLFEDDDLPTEQGTPTYWQAEPRAAAPHLQISSLITQQETRSLEWSVLLLGVLLTAGGISFSSRLLAWSRFFWPEQMLLLGYAAALLWGPGWIALFLMLFGVLGRAIIIGQWAVLAFRRLALLVVPPTGASSA